MVLPAALRLHCCLAVHNQNVLYIAACLQSHLHGQSMLGQQARATRTWLLVDPRCRAAVVVCCLMRHCFHCASASMLPSPVGPCTTYLVARDEGKGGHAPVVILRQGSDATAERSHDEAAGPSSIGLLWAMWPSGMTRTSGPRTSSMEPLQCNQCHANTIKPHEFHTGSTGRIPSPYSAPAPGPAPTRMWMSVWHSPLCVTRMSTSLVPSSPTLWVQGLRGACAPRDQRRQRAAGRSHLRSEPSSSFPTVASLHVGHIVRCEA